MRRARRRRRGRASLDDVHVWGGDHASSPVDGDFLRVESRRREGLMIVRPYV